MHAIACNDKIYNENGAVLMGSGGAGHRKQDQSQVSGSCKSSILTLETEHEAYWYYKNLSVMNYRGGGGSNQQNPGKERSKAAMFLRQDNQTIAEHYFTKNGVYLTRKDNEYLFKCSKERCLLDFSIQKSTLINN